MSVCIDNVVKKKKIEQWAMCHWCTYLDPAETSFLICVFGHTPSTNNYSHLHQQIIVNILIYSFISYWHSYRASVVQQLQYFFPIFHCLTPCRRVVCVWCRAPVPADNKPPWLEFKRTKKKKKINVNNFESLNHYYSSENICSQCLILFDINFGTSNYLGSSRAESQTYPVEINFKWMM